MYTMRVVWKDSIKPKEVRQYRKHNIFRQTKGWSVDIPGDNNIYAAIGDAYNIIDKTLGGHGKFGKSSIRGERIKVIGQVNA
jgi:hypothetical protein